MLNRIFGKFSGWGPFFLRLGVGVIMLVHGAQKLFGAWGGPGLKGFSQMLASMGLKPALAWAVLVALVEFAGGIFLILGIMTRLSALLIGIVMLVAIFGVHWSGGFLAARGGFEYPLMILAGCICLLFTGGGRASLKE